MRRWIWLPFIFSCETATGTGAPSAVNPAQGSEQGACFDDGTCNEGLTCASDLCVVVEGQGGGGGQGNAGGVGGAVGGTGGGTDCAVVPCQKGAKAKCACPGCNKNGTSFCKDDGTFDDCSCPVDCDPNGAVPILCSQPSSGAGGSGGVAGGASGASGGPLGGAGNGGTKAGAGGAPSLCTPGTTIGCSCPAGGVGSQSCNGSGTAYGPCLGCPEETGGAGGKPPECGDIFCGTYNTPNGSKSADCGSCVEGYQCVPYVDNLNFYCCKPSGKCEPGFCGKKKDNCGQEIDCTAKCSSDEICLNDTCCQKPQYQKNACGTWAAECGATADFGDCGIAAECIATSVPGMKTAGFCEKYCLPPEYPTSFCTSQTKKYFYVCTKKNEWMDMANCQAMACGTKGCNYCCEASNL